MRIFLDTANIEEIREVARWGFLSGVTTNPTLIAKTAGKSHEVVIREIAALVDGDISAETVSMDTAGMLEEAQRFAAWHPQVVVKVPSTPNGWAAVKQLRAEGIRTNVTYALALTRRCSRRSPAPTISVRSSGVSTISRRMACRSCAIPSRSTARTSCRRWCLPPVSTRRCWSDDRGAKRSLRARRCTRDRLMSTRERAPR